VKGSHIMTIADPSQRPNAAIDPAALSLPPTQPIDIPVPEPKR
jgi:hypothetical protein